MVFGVIGLRLERVGLLVDLLVMPLELELVIPSTMDARAGILSF